MKKLYILLILLTVGMGPMTYAQVTLFEENFESGYTDNVSLAGVNGWVVGNGTAQSSNVTGQGYDGSDWYGYFTTGAFTTIAQNLAVEAGKEYTFSFYSYKTGAGATRLKVFNSNLNEIAIIAADGTADEWIARTVTFTAPASEVLTFQLIQNWGSGYVRIDNVSIVCNDCTLSTDSEESFEFAMYPNPVSERLYLKTQESLATLTVYDFLGKEILHIKEPQAHVNTSSLPAGIYVLNLVAKNGTTVSRKFVKQ